MDDYVFIKLLDPCKENILLFFMLTVLFITILDTFSPYNGETSIVIVLISGFIAMGLLYVQKLGSENTEHVKARLLLGGIGSLIGILVISGTLAYILPKAGPSWPDPVPFLTSAKPSSTNGEGGSGVQRKVGYGENDERLGGAFVEDDTPVFTRLSQRSNIGRLKRKIRILQKDG